MPPEITICFVHWIEPLKNESLVDYCHRLALQIDTSNDFILVGLSFGGIVAIEIGKFLDPKLIILISTIATKHELPFKFKLAKWLHLTDVLPVSLLKYPRPLIYWIFNADTKKEKALLLSFLKSVSANYLKWSLNEVMNWGNEKKPANAFHIHGMADRIFPYDKTHAELKIKNGGHLMVYDRAAEISRIITEKINAIR